MNKDYKYLKLIDEKMAANMRKICKFSLGKTRNSSLTCWTKTAVECYENGCNCQTCNLIDFLDLKKADCKMKYAVVELLRRYGKPKEIAYYD